MEETEIKDSSRDIRNNEEIYKRYVDQEIKERNEVTKGIIRRQDTALRTCCTLLSYILSLQPITGFLNY